MKVDSKSFFRGRQPPARSPSLARCSTINSTLELRRACCLKKQSCYHVSKHAPNPHTGIKPFLICKTQSTLLWTGRHFQQGQRCFFFSPSLNQFCFLFLYTNVIFCVIRGLPMNSWVMSEVKLFGRRNNTVLRLNLHTWHHLIMDRLERHKEVTSMFLYLWRKSSCT